jgi:hypothetical protein
VDVLFILLERLRSAAREERMRLRWIVVALAASSAGLDGAARRDWGLPCADDGEQGALTGGGWNHVPETVPQHNASQFREPPFARGPRCPRATPFSSLVPPPHPSAARRTARTCPRSGAV